MSDAFSEKVISAATKDIILLSALEETYKGLYAFTANNLYNANVPYDFASRSVFPYIRNPQFLNSRNKFEFFNCKSIVDMYKNNTFDELYSDTVNYFNNYTFSDEEISVHLKKQYSNNYTNFHPAIKSKNNFGRFLDIYMDSIIDLADNIKERGIISNNHESPSIKYTCIDALINMNNNGNWDVFSNPSSKMCKFMASIILVGRFDDSLRYICLNWSDEKREEVLSYLPVDYHQTFKLGHYDYSKTLFNLVKKGLDNGYQVFSKRVFNIKQNDEQLKAVVKYLTFEENKINDFDKIVDVLSECVSSPQTQKDVFYEFSLNFDESDTYVKKLANFRMMLITLNVRNEFSTDSDVSGFSGDLERAFAELKITASESEENALLLMEALAQGVSVYTISNLCCDVLDESLHMLAKDDNALNLDNKNSEFFFKRLLAYGYQPKDTLKPFSKDIENISKNTLGEKILPFLNKNLTIKDLKKYPAFSHLILSAKADDKNGILFDTPIKDSNFETVLFINRKSHDEIFKRRLTPYIANTFLKPNKEELKQNGFFNVKPSDEDWKTKVLVNLLRKTNYNTDLFNYSVLPVLKETLDNYVKSKIPEQIKYANDSEYFLKKITNQVGESQLFIQTLTSLVKDAKNNNQEFRDMVFRISCERSSKIKDSAVRLSLDNVEEFKVYAESLVNFSGFNTYTVTAIPQCSKNDFEKLHKYSLLSESGVYPSIELLNLSPYSGNLLNSLKELNDSGSEFVGDLFHGKLNDIEYDDLYKLSSYVHSLRLKNEELYLSCVTAIANEVKYNRTNGSVSSVVSRLITTKDVLPVLESVSKKEIEWTKVTPLTAILGSDNFRIGASFSSPVAYNIINKIRLGADSFFMYEDRKNLEKNKHLIEGKDIKSVDLTDLETFLKARKDFNQDDEAFKIDGRMGSAAIEVLKQSLGHSPDSFEVKKAELYEKIITMSLAPLKMVFESEVGKFRSIKSALLIESQISNAFQSFEDSKELSGTEKFKL